MKAAITRDALLYNLQHLAADDTIILPPRPPQHGRQGEREWERIRAREIICASEIERGDYSGGKSQGIRDGRNSGQSTAGAVLRYARDGGCAGVE